MKRLLPVIIVLCLLGTIFTCLPKTGSNEVSINSLDDVNGKAIGIQSGAGYEKYLTEKCPGATAVFFNEFSSIYPALTQGKIDAMITESLAYAVEKIEIPSLVKLEEPIATLDYCIGVGQTNNANTIHAQLNEFIAKSKADGTIDGMINYWLDNYDRDNAVVDKSGISGENGKLVIAVEAAFEPMCFAGKGGDLLGFNIDFMYRFARAYGYEPSFETLEYDAMVTALASGKTAIAVGVIPDEERAQEVNFTDSILDFDIIIAYDNGEGDNISLIDNLVSSFNKTFIRDDRWLMFVEGIGNTLLISVLAVIFGTILGLLMYLWVAHGKRIEKTFVSILCWMMSSTPTVVLLMILYYVIFGQYIISNLAVAIAGFSLLFGCGFYERIESGVYAVGKGQEEAARAQGLSADQTFFHIIFPQAIEHFMPAYQGDVISLIQETSVVGYIAIKDLTKMSDLVRGRTYEAFFPLLSTACIYFLLILLLTQIFRYIAYILNNKNRKKHLILKGIITKDNQEN